MSETSGKSESLKIAEIGRQEFDRLTSVLNNRESNEYNLVGWEGTVIDLKSEVESNSLYPASAFAVVSEGISRYKRTDERMNDDTESMRELANVLYKGSDIFGRAGEFDEAGLKDQIKKYIESHDGKFDININWKDFIKERADRIKNKADSIDEANR
ncbi:MAG: hypothetical protein ABIJ05_02755 [Patescibacteria group bacterium]